MDNRTHGERRRETILAAGLTLWPSVTAREIARSVGLSHSAVLYHFGNVEALREAVAVYAVKTGNKKVVPMLIAQRHPAAAGLTIAQRRQFLADC